MNQTKVFVPNKGGHDYSEAQRFGSLSYVSEGYVDRWNINLMYRAWVKALEDSSPDDWILVTSLNTLCSVGAACFAFKHGKLNLLLFKDGVYLERRLVVGELLTNEKGEQDDNRAAGEPGHF